ncbi:hypothetical protein CRUP_023157 [Coryphaenoides rupestris]|nr:hypothetical protein CRUP_023157 [Coryphaenoides rupestris]
MGNAGSMDHHSDLRGHHVPSKLPMPEQSELEERFAIVLRCGPGAVVRLRVGPLAELQAAQRIWLECNTEEEEEVEVVVVVVVEDGLTQLQPGLQHPAFRPPRSGKVDVVQVVVVVVENSMNLPPDKARLLRQYDNEKKWELICDQERFQVKNPPHTYIQKLRSYLDPAVTRKKFRRRVQESTQVLRELEISLRTNHIGWVREFLNEENKGLDVLVEYLSFAQYAVT